MSVTLTLTDPGYPQEQLANHGRDNIMVDDDMEDARESELISFENTTQGLGLKICGGCSLDGKEDFGIFIKRVLPNGLAEAKGEEVQNGDLILEVNGQSMEGITYDRAVSILRQASASNHVEMVITRDEESRRELVDYQAKYGPLSNCGKKGNTSNESADVDFQKNGAAFKGASLDLSDSLDQNEFHLNLSGHSSNMNGHISPSSSHSSEVANHFMEASNSNTHMNQSFTAGVGRETPVDSIDSMLSKKLLKDPNLKLHIDQLEGAMMKLGLDLSPQKHQLLRERLTVDSEGMVRFEEFAKVIKTLFRNEMGALKGRMTPLSHYNNGIGSQQGAIVGGHQGALGGVVKERDALKAEVAALKEELKARNQSCKQSEEQLLNIRKQTQSVIEEGRSLRTKLHLAEQAQTRAQQTERDYEEVVAMLENEVAQLRLQGGKSDTTNMQRRLAVLVCQLKKAESGMKTYEVATEKLVKHIEHSLEVLAGIEKSPRVGDAAKAKAQKKKAISTLGSDGRDVIKLARSLMETVALPFGWEEAYTSEGVRYYINHLNQTTTWTHPVSCMEHQTHSKSSSSQGAPPPPPPPPQHSEIPSAQHSQPPPPPPQLSEAQSQPEMRLPNYKAPPQQQESPEHQQQQQHQHQQQQQQQQQHQQQQQNEHQHHLLKQQEQQERQKKLNGEKLEKSKEQAKHSPRRGVYKESAMI